MFYKLTKQVIFNRINFASTLCKCRVGATSV